MKPSGECFLFICYLTVTIVAEPSQDKNTRRDGEAIDKYLALYCHIPVYTDDGILVQTKTQFSDLPQFVRARSEETVNIGSKRGNQFKNFMLGREASKDTHNQVQKASYIPVKSNGKRNYSPSTVYGIYTGSDDADLFQKWLSTYYYQQ